MQLFLILNIYLAAIMSAAPAYPTNPEKDHLKGRQKEGMPVRRIRITLTSGNVKSLEKGW